MVGLSVILENHTGNKTPQVISKGAMISQNPKSHPNGFTDFGRGFLEYCFLCARKISPGKDIYMYEGYKAFCTEDCRCRQIFMDERERSDAASRGCTREYNSSSSSSSSSSASSKAR